MGAQIVRLEGWEVRLFDAVEAARARPFEWGHHDCATWAFDVRRSLVGGDDLAGLWRGRYRTALGAQRVMRKLGWSDIEAMGRSLLGDPLASVLMAQRGDMLLSGADPAFGVCVGARGAFVGPDGLAFVPLGQCLMAWSV